MKANAAWQEEWRRHPNKRFKLIARVSGDVGQAAIRLREKGIFVRRRCRLVNGCAIEATGAQAEALLQESWIASLEPDELVRAM